MSQERSEQPPESDQRNGESTVTVVVALAANALIALAKSIVAGITGSASMVAEAAHSWADTGNEVFLLIADRSGRRPRDTEHPRGYGRATYIWSLVAAFGLFSAGAVLAIWHGITSLAAGGEEETTFWINYLVLGIAFVLEGVSFAQASRQVRGEASEFGLDRFRYVSRTSDSTLRAVFLEDFSALIGLAIATTAIVLHQVTGQAAYDAVGSIAVGALLAVVAVFLMRRNMQYLLGKGVSRAAYRRVLVGLLQHPQIERVTYLHAEVVGPSRFFVVAAVDLTGDDTEALLAVRFRELERDIEQAGVIEDAVLTPAPPDEPALSPETFAGPG